MSNKRITDLTELTTPTTDDVFPVVDIATNTTTKVQLANLPVQTAVTTALATKQATLVSGTNIKTVNSTTLLGSGDIAVQPTLVSGVSIKTVNSTSLLGSGDIPIPIVTPSGVAGAIQFSNGSAFASDATKFFWDNTNKRLAVGSDNPYAATFQVKGSGADVTTNSIFVENSVGLPALIVRNNGTVNLPGNLFAESDINVGSSSTLGARLGIKGSGSTSATTSLLVQNSAGTEWFRIYDNGTTSFAGNITASANIECFSTIFVRGQLWGGASQDLRLGTNGFGNAMAIASATGDVSISTSLTLNSTTKGFLPPRMTTTQKNAIASPATGLVLYDSTTNKLQCYNGSTWNDLF
jgi:hypothetical protein